MLYDYQTTKSNQCKEKLFNFNIAYINAPPRVGKTLIAIHTVESLGYNKCLVVTMKSALEGWGEALDKYSGTTLFKVVNFHQVHKIENTDFNVVIIDESHRYLSSFPKKSNLWKVVRKYTINKPIIFISATPNVESSAQLFHQLALSDFSPFKSYKNFYSWFKDYGIPNTIRLNSMVVNCYKKVKEKDVLDKIKHLFVYVSLKEVDMIAPIDKIHCVSLNKSTVNKINILRKEGGISLCLNNKIESIVSSTSAHEKIISLQIEGGTIIHNKENYLLDNEEKINYIKNNFSLDKIAIVYYFEGERIKLLKHFPNARLMQSTSNIEGVDLHQYDNIVVYSQSYSGSAYIQMRARQCNQKRKKDIFVNFLIVKNYESHRIYKKLLLKKNKSSLYKNL